MNEENKGGSTHKKILLIISIVCIVLGFIAVIGSGSTTLIALGFWTILFSSVCEKIGQSKGLTDGFYYGWWLGIIGLLIVACLPAKDSSKKSKITVSNKYEDLEKLQKLKESGAITDEEFNKEKEKILN